MLLLVAGGAAAEEPAVQARFGGYLQVDARYFGRSAENVSELLVRRLRPTADLSLGERVSVRAMPDFGSGKVSLVDAYLDITLWPWLRLRAGKAKVPISLERLLADANALLFAERGLPSNLAPERDVGVQLLGDVGHEKLSYAVGLFNGAPDSVSGDLPPTGERDLAARVFLKPWAGADRPIAELGLGLAGSWGIHHGDAANPQLPVYRTAWQGPIFAFAPDAVADGERLRWSPQVSWRRGSLAAFAEYVVSEQQVRRGEASIRVSARAYQLAAGWVVTGGKVLAGGVVAEGTKRLGEWQVVARVHGLDLSPRSVGDTLGAAGSATHALAFGVGLNWYASRYIRVLVNAERTGYAGERAAENALVARIQGSL